MAVIARSPPPPDLNDKRNAALIEVGYLLSGRQAWRMPMRSEIDPTNMPHRVLPRISIVEVVRNDRRSVYHLVGTGDMEVRVVILRASQFGGFFRPARKMLLLAMTGWSRPEPHCHTRGRSRHPAA